MNAPLNERSPKRVLPQTSAPPNEPKKIASENGPFRTQNANKIDQKKIVIRYLCWEAGLGEKIS